MPITIAASHKPEREVDVGDGMGLALRSAWSNGSVLGASRFAVLSRMAVCLVLGRNRGSIAGQSQVNRR